MAASGRPSVTTDPRCYTEVAAAEMKVGDRCHRYDQLRPCDVQVRI